MIGEIVGFLGLLLLFGIPILCVVYKTVTGIFNNMLLWLLAIPVVMGIVGQVMVLISWRMAFRKKFHYDCQYREATWIDAGAKCSYRFTDWEAEQRPRTGNP